MSRRHVHSVELTTMTCRCGATAEEVEAEYRQHAVRQLLATLDEARCTLQKGEPGDGQPIPIMSPLYHAGSYAELERCLLLMREQERSLWWNVNARYLTSRRRTTWICSHPDCGVNFAGFVNPNTPPPEGLWHKHPRSLSDRTPIRVPAVWGLSEAWDTAVLDVLVDAGVRWLADHMHYCQLPKELLAA